MKLDASFRTYIIEVDLHTECGRAVRYTGQCKASVPDPDTVLDGAIQAALSYHPGAEVLESQLRRT